MSLRIDHTDLHLEALSEAELIGLADQALASLNARLVEEDFNEARHTLGLDFQDTAEARTALRRACDAWDQFADYFREP